ncbi:hypothetical protein PLICRDRAFT_136237 [Plicaturopsis crispa FD-325 SS-3]|nr:hypothetical protein PLICRDRAFT_136237 [Plicaturopsis crispa FD-325 SS-3]
MRVFLPAQSPTQKYTQVLLRPTARKKEQKIPTRGHATNVASSRQGGPCRAEGAGEGAEACSWGNELCRCRLKLKCDKTVPCSSCSRRGCSEICPNGSLITGQGTRFVLADTEKLHRKIALMSDRIRQLEVALAIEYATTSKDTHPLLTPELMSIKSSLELHAAQGSVNGSEQLSEAKDQDEESQYIDAFGTLALHDDGAATFYGRSAGSESLLIREHHAQGSKTPSSPLHEEWGPELPHSVRQLASAFPLPAIGFDSMSLDVLAKAFLPGWEEASHLCELYLEQAPWFFGAVTKRQLVDELIPLWYHEAPMPPTADNQLEPGSGGSAHELALLFVIFCFGALTDLNQPPAPDNPNAEQYYQLTRAALALEPVLDRPPSVATVQTLSLMAIYQGLCSGENSIESTWALMGLSTKLAQSVGLHRDCARWGLKPSEVQKRRALFWELFITDGWQSLATGRLSTFALPFVDSELPSDPDETIASDGSRQPSFSMWKARFGAECVSAVVRDTLTSQAPKYSKILQLDRKIRDMDLPLYAQGRPPTGAGLAQTMSHFMPTNYRELTLLYVHRCFFAHAVSNFPRDPLKSPYAPSFLSGYNSACTLIQSLRTQFEMFPVQIARFWVLWTHAFSSAVMLSSVITHGPTSKVSSAALVRLQDAADLFRQAAHYGGRAVKFLPIVQRLLEKAEKALTDGYQGVIPLNPNDIFAPSRAEEKDELSIFSGRTNTVSMKAIPRSGSHRSPGIHSDGSVSEPTSSVDESSPPLPPAFQDVHPYLVEQLHEFDGRLNTQIEDAQMHYDRRYTDDHRQPAIPPTIRPGAQPQQHPHPHPNPRSQLHVVTHPLAQYQHQPNYPAAPPFHASPPAPTPAPAPAQMYHQHLHHHHHEIHDPANSAPHYGTLPTVQYAEPSLQGYQPWTPDPPYQAEQMHAYAPPQQQQQQQQQPPPQLAQPPYPGLATDGSNIQDTWTRLMYQVAPFQGIPPSR